MLFSFIWLALAAALIWVVAYLVKRDAAIRTSNPHVMILAQQALGPRERVIVLNVLNRILVVGHTPSQITLITELDPEDVANLAVFLGSDMSGYINGQTINVCGGLHTPN